MLAIVIGYYVIGNVHHALHTPLMSITNAISGIIIVGALLQIGHADTTITVLSFVAILLASINIFGGFAVTRRMLGMFSKVTAPNTASAQAAYIVAALLFILALAGLSKHETSRPGIVYGIAGMAIALAATIGLAVRGEHGRAGLAATGVGLLVVAMVIGAVLGTVAGAPRRDDRHAAADRDAAQLRRSRRGARRAGTATTRSRPRAPRRPRSPARCCASTTPRCSSACSSAR